MDPFYRTLLPFEGNGNLYSNYHKATWGGPLSSRAWTLRSSAESHALFLASLRLRVKGLAFRGQSLGFGAYVGLKLRVWSLGFGFRV